MENFNNIELLNEEEKKLSSYKEYLEDLAINNNNGVIFNAGKAHASILMATLLANTCKSLKMYCTGLRPDILDGFQGSYWDVFQKFFERIDSEHFKKNSIQILLQEDDRIEEMKKNPDKITPFSILKKATKKFPNIIVIKKIKADGKKKIEDDLGGLPQVKSDYNINFSVFDNKAFRLEYMPKEYKAIGSFDNVDWCKRLSCCFDGVFNNQNLSQPVVL